MTHNESPNGAMRLIRTGGPVHGATIRVTNPRPLRKVVENGKLLPEYAHIVIYDEFNAQSSDQEHLSEPDHSSELTFFS